MAGKKIYKCEDCAFVGLSKMRFHGVLYVLLPLWLFMIIFSLFVPLIGVPAIIGALLFMRKPHCSSCGSMNVVRYFTEEEIQAAKQIKADSLKQQAELKRNEARKRYEIGLLKSEIDDVSDGSRVLKVRIVGGAGWERMHNVDVYLKISNKSIGFYDLNDASKVLVLCDQVRSVDVGGPGRVTSGPNIGGGGFGVEGAITGMAIATVANTLLTHSSTKTIVRILLDDSEIVFISSDVDLDSMRLILSPLYVAIGNMTSGSNTSIVAQLSDLKGLRDSGALDDGQYQKAIEKILS